MARAPDPASESTLQSLTEQLKEQNFKLTQIRNIGEAQVEAAEDAAAVAREAAREAARAAGDDEEGVFLLSPDHGAKPGQKIS